jgi:hypothetical protein
VLPVKYEQGFYIPEDYSLLKSYIENISYNENAVASCMGELFCHKTWASNAI